MVYGVRDGVSAQLNAAGRTALGSRVRLLRARMRNRGTARTQDLGHHASAAEPRFDGRTQAGRRTWAHARMHAPQSAMCDTGGYRHACARCIARPFASHIGCPPCCGSGASGAVERGHREGAARAARRYGGCEPRRRAVYDAWRRRVPVQPTTRFPHLETCSCSS
ncbi:hypothetical protein CXQ84_24600 [Burkholderia pseudomallei]|nr:hypothetical protein CXQ84_24600 [Burkholderia pseudomallei]